jgi:hypothetical protein
MEGPGRALGDSERRLISQSERFAKQPMNPRLHCSCLHRFFTLLLHQFPRSLPLLSLPISLQNSPVLTALVSTAFSTLGVDDLIAPGTVETKGYAILSVHKKGAMLHPMVFHILKAGFHKISH